MTFDRIQMVRTLVNAGDNACINGTPMIPLHRDTVAALVDCAEALDDLLASSGARGRYHAMEYGDAVDRAEAAITKATRP